MFSKSESVGREPGSELPFKRAHANAYRFGNVEVDFRTGELRKSGLRIRIQDQPLQLLAILLLNPGEIVTREQFRELLWPADTFVDFDHGLNSAIKRLRDALDDDHEHPRLIETIPRHGYRFIAPVAKFPQPIQDPVSPREGSAAGLETTWESTALPTTAAREANSEKPGIDRQSRRPTRAWLGLGAAMLVVVMLSKPTYGPQRYADYGGAPRKLIMAVLPFQSLTRSVADNFIAEGMTQEVVTHMGREHSKQLAVISGAALTPYKSVKNPILVMGKELGVGYVLEGSTRTQGKTVRIAVQLIRVRDQSYIWADSYDGNVDDMLTVEAAVAVKIGRAVCERLPQ